MPPAARSEEEEEGHTSVAVASLGVRRPGWPETARLTSHEPSSWRLSSGSGAGRFLRRVQLDSSRESCGL